MTLRPLRRGAAQLAAPPSTAVGVARCAPGLEPLDLLGLDARRHGQDRAFAGGERRGLGLGEAVDADHDLLAALDRLEPRAC